MRLARVAFVALVGVLAAPGVPAQHAHGLGRTFARGAARAKRDADIARLHGQHLLGRAHQPLLRGGIARRKKLEAIGRHGRHGRIGHQGMSRDSRPEIRL